MTLITKNSSTYKMKNIAVTGCCGFICSGLIIYLVNEHPEIQFIGIDKLTYCSSLNHLKEIEGKENFKFVLADVCDIDIMDRIFQIYNIDGLIHLAASTHVDASWGFAADYVKNNTMSVTVMLELSRKYHLERILMVSTDEVVGSKDHMCTEETLLQPSNIYSASKAAGEMLCSAYFHSYQLPILIVRPNNAFGPRQFPEKVIPKFILRLMNKQDLFIQGNGNQMRSFIYIDDLVQAFIAIWEKGVVGDIYNIGSEYELTVNYVAEKLISSLGDGNQTVKYGPDRPFNDIRYLVSCDKLRKLGWEQKISFEEGLEKTIKWYQSTGIDYWNDRARDLVLK